MKYTISFVCLTHRGRLRQENQDNYVCGRTYNEPRNESSVDAVRGSFTSGEPCVYGVFDGMGGEECGEIASYLAAKEAAQANITSDVPSALTDFCKTANMSVYEYQKKNGISSMGTTAALLHFGEKEITVCNVGDSRVYRFSEGELKQISVDHTLPAPFGRKSPLSQYLGMDPAESTVEPYICRGGYREGDIYLACSDGLTDMVTEENIAAILAEKGIDGAKELMDTVLQNGGKDNITLVLTLVRGESGIKHFLKNLFTNDTSEEKQ